MKPNYLLWVIIILLALGLVYQFMQNQQNNLALRQEIVRLRSKPASTNKEGKQVDPYQAKQVKNSLTKKAAELQSCYLDYLKGKPKVTGGVLTFDWQISADGHMIHPAVVSNGLGDPKLADCLLTKLKPIVFPPPPYDGYYIEHKLNFQTEAELKRQQAEREKLEIKR